MRSEIYQKWIFVCGAKIHFVSCAEKSIDPALLGGRTSLSSLRYTRYLCLKANTCAWHLFLNSIVCPIG